MCSIQVWPTSDAPGWLFELLGRAKRYDWVALVSRELNAKDVLSLLVSNAGGMPVETVNLADGRALLAGDFGEEKDQPQSKLERRPVGRERVRSAF